MASPDDGDTYYWKRRLESSGDTELDYHCRRMLELQMNVFAVRPGFTFYDDSDGKNALADPVARFPDHPDGTIMFGTGFLKDHANSQRDGNRFLVSVEIIMAHEFAHILQYQKLAWSKLPDRRWELEPHADYMAGWYVGYYTGTEGVGYTMQRSFDELFAATRTMFALGDSLFNDPTHHGQEEYRAAMVRTGYFDGGLKRDAAFRKGGNTVGLNFPEHWRLSPL